MPERMKVYGALDSEREYQERHWPDNPLSIGEQILLAEEYLARARHAWSIEKDESEDPQSLHMLRKVGGIIVHCLEDHGAPRRK